MAEMNDPKKSDFIAGRITKFFAEKGYGFIKAPGFDKFIFFHSTSLVGGNSSPLYKGLTTKKEGFLPVNVNFRIREEPKGLRAYEVTADLYYLQTRMLEKITQECFRSKNPLEAFITLVPPEVYWLIDREPILKNDVITQILDSESIWNRLLEFSETLKDLIKFFSDPSSSWSASEIKMFEKFIILVCNTLNCQPEGRVDYFPDKAVVVQPLKNLKSPLRFFREGRSTALLIVPDFKTLDLLVRKSPEFISSSNRALKLILVLTDEREVIENQIRLSKNNIVIIHPRIDSYTTVGKEEKFRFTLGRALRNVLSPEALQPFVVSEDYHSDIFSGRRDLRQEILESLGTHYIIYGGRKIGKTWLIHDLCDQCAREPYNEKYVAVYTSLQSCETLESAVFAIEGQIRDTPAFAGILSSKTFLSINGDPLRRLELLLDRVHKLSGKIILLAIDEVDDLLKTDKGLFKKLRQISSNHIGAYKLIFTGFKELFFATYEETSNDPFVNWGTRIPLNCLSKEDMAIMVTKPFQWMGIELKPTDESVVNKIFELTSGHPYYTQLLCLNIAGKALRKDSRLINPEFIDECAKESFMTEIFTVFGNNLSPLQQLIGKIFASENKPVSDIDIENAIMDRFKIHIDKHRIHMEMKILQACSVFKPVPASSSLYEPLMQRINQEFFREQDDNDLALRYLEDPDEH